MMIVMTMLMMMMMMMSCSDGRAMTSMMELLMVVTLTLTVISSPSHGRPHHLRHDAHKEWFDDTEDLQTPGKV